MNTVEFLPHVADIRMRVEAESVEEIFHSAVRGMNELLKKDYCDRNLSFALIEQLNIESSDVTCLLIDFLSEVLAQSQINNAVYCRLEVNVLSEKKLDAMIYGTVVAEFDYDIKAVTYHEANLHVNEHQHWETHIIFDI